MNFFKNNTLNSLCFNLLSTKKWTYGTCGGGVQAHPSRPPPYGPGLTSPLKFSDEVRQELVSHGLLG